MNELTDVRTVYCANCATPMQGEFCHHCGQSVHSVLKPVHHMLEDGMDMFLHVDGRIVHTLPPLFTRPGFLTLEYFAGRRQRYVPPFRLMFVLCLLAFFALHLAIESSHPSSPYHGKVVQTDDFASAKTPQQVRQRLREELDGLAQGRAVAAALAPEGVKSLEVAEQGLRKAADKRLAELGAAPIPAGSTALVPAPAGTGPSSDWEDITHSPVHIGWLPSFVNERLTAFARNVGANVRAWRHGDEEAQRQARERMLSGIFGMLPQAMVVMIPIFALLLKLFYVFKRRLYMEHFIVALHSHAFLFLALLLAVLLDTLAAWLRPHAAWAAELIGPPKIALVLWMPAYLLIMQKRIYRQGWLMTLVKYWWVGWCYLWLLLAVLLVAVVLGAGH